MPTCGKAHALVDFAQTLAYLRNVWYDTGVKKSTKRGRQRRRDSRDGGVGRGARGAGSDGRGRRDAATHARARGSQQLVLQGRKRLACLSRIPHAPNRLGGEFRSGNLVGVEGGSALLRQYLVRELLPGAPIPP